MITERTPSKYGLELIGENIGIVRVDANAEDSSGVAFSVPTRTTEHEIISAEQLYARLSGFIEIVGLELSITPQQVADLLQLVVDGQKKPVE